MKIHTERIECYWARGSGKNRDYRFYVDFPRKASKDEELTRKEFIKCIKGRDGTEGRGYNWRVSIATLRSALEFLPDPKAIKSEMERFDADGVRPPSEPYHVIRLDVHNTDMPTIIHLDFDSNGPVPEAFRRACDYWKTTHHLGKDEYQHVDLLSGRRMSITSSMLMAFESWLLFDEPWRVLYKNAFAERKIIEDEHRARQYESDAPFREKYPNWNEWTSTAQDQKRYEAWRQNYEKQRQWEERIREFIRENEKFHKAYSFSFADTSKIREAFSLLGLSDVSTQEEVKKRYRELAKEHHPDIGGDANKFKVINSANEILVKHFKGI